MQSTIYLDYAATTPVAPEVMAQMVRYLGLPGFYANPASLHAAGKMALAAIDHAREQVANLIRAEADEIIWTSGGTEANNLALKGALALYQNRGKHIITLKTEHPSILGPCEYLEKQGFKVTYLAPQSNGALDLLCLQQALRPDTILVSIMHVNNETGAIQDIQKVAQIVKAQGILFHVDAVQSAGKIPLNVQQVPVDLISFSAHKIYGPKGIGALYVRRKPRVRVAAQLHGGGQEWAMRSGTLPTHQIVGMGEAYSQAKKNMQQDYEKAERLRTQFLQGLKSVSPIIHGDLAQTLPHIVNIALPVLAETLIQGLPDVAFSVGSACQSQHKGPSYVLRAMGISTECALRSMRFSFGRSTSEHEIQLAVQRILTLVA